MSEPMTIQRLLLLRKVTRAVAEFLRGQLKEHLQNLAPLIRPKLLLGDYVSGSTKETPNFADKNFQELQAFYQSFATAKPFGTPRELKPPLEIHSSPLEIYPVDSIYEAHTEREAKTITVASPLRWVLSYPDVPLARLRELFADRTQSMEALQRFAVHYAVLAFMLRKSPGFLKTFEALRFPITVGTMAEFGGLPIVMIASPLATVRPPDDVIIENTEISGTNTFEEVIDVSGVAAIPDPFREQLVEIVRGFGLH